MSEASLPAQSTWYKDAVIYQLHVRTFADSNADGIGDFPGLTSRLDYLAGLGVSCLWLLPFYPSPLRDDGYDIAHYQSVHPSYGTLKDFRTFLRAAHERGLKVVTELVINHTSDQHPWFQAARRAPAGSRKRDYYVWSATSRRYEGTRIIFSDSETSNWAWDATAGAYYWHRFFHHQPDLNFDNTHVRLAVLKVMRFWLDMGVDGMRLDAVPYLIERDGTNCENLPETHALLRELRRDLDARYPDRVFLAEANGWPGDVRAYFGDGDECHMAFNFPLMPRIYLALQQEDAHPVMDIIRQTPDIPDNCQWALFLRNHDELTLESVTAEERDSMYRAYAADPQMRVNLGIRRRLAPLMQNNRERIQLVNSLLFSLPGTPIVYYGDEIGMGDNIYLGDRNGVRTPMQWTSDRNAGFSAADPARLFAPVIMDPVYGYQAVNVEAQDRSPSSLLQWMTRLIATRRAHRAFGRGTLQFVSTANRKVLAYARQLDGEVLLCVANLSRHPQAAELDLRMFDRRVPVELMGETAFPRIDGRPWVVTLGPYGFYWFVLREVPESQAAVRNVPAAAPKVVDAMALPALLLGPAWESAFETATHEILERDYLPAHLASRRWFAASARNLTRVRIRDHAVLSSGAEPVVAVLVDVTFNQGPDETYFLPMTFLAGPAADELLKVSPELVIARISGARRGVLHERLDWGAADRLFDAIASDRVMAMAHGTLRASAAPRFSALRGADAVLNVVRANADQNNTSFRIGDRFVLKLFRRVEPGTNPEIEIGRHLRGRLDFERVPPLAGTLEYEDARGRTSLAVLHGFVPHAVSGWAQALDEVDRYFERAPADQAAPSLQHLGWYADALRRLGQRTAELHVALATPAGDSAFQPEPLNAQDLQSLAGQLRDAAAATLAALRQHLAMLPEDAQAIAATVLASEARLLQLAGADVSEAGAGLLKTRTHGDYHLAQVLWSDGDFVVVDFEGPPQESIDERRRHRSPMADIAGMIRSFTYAARARLSAWRDRGPAIARRIEPWADFWSSAATERFLDGYRAAAAGHGFVPAAPAALNALLRLFLMECALDDLARELQERPSWAAIPLASLAALAGAVTPPSSAGR